MTGFDYGLLTGKILIDLQKAFDTIKHGILLQKMAFLGFSNHLIMWFESHLSDGSFRVNIKNKYSIPAKILVHLLFLLYLNDMKDCRLWCILYADDSSLVYQQNDISKTEQNLNKNFSNIYNWFVKQKLNKTGNLDVWYGTIQIKQYHTVTYLVCASDENLSGEPMTLKVIGKINCRLFFF